MLIGWPIYDINSLEMYSYVSHRTFIYRSQLPSGKRLLIYQILCIVMIFLLVRYTQFNPWFTLAKLRVRCLYAAIDYRLLKAYLCMNEPH